ncbi:DUF1294 domain-containing protein|uniref:Uncharacterized membrane protein YsdA, DUF1294 family n=1 Tax=Dendrosporobacter quercicolus TaxID=146817 RepID=A0A1G9VPW7_9FIRM|nr:DUF1294 domain-containing protein [Dendrosporobacter quercicolus]NSL47834.1 DUF1294 domain-containing protein [Dendrosporobacter quercicolus DSM 1736]SDM74274.1 Uncharacterized membrane protein YsdA, DUF1294 family [Dendrosporobacter quercicolus]
MIIWIAVYVIWNTIAFFRMGADKNYAKTGRARIPERTFFLWAALFGAAGIWGGMLFFRHKTRHRSFRIAIPALLALNIGLLAVQLVSFY